MKQPRLVILESPYAGKGDTPEERERDRDENEVYALDCLLDSLKRGEAPMASHLLYTRVLDDDDPAQRKLGIEAGLAWGRGAEATVCYLDRGMSAGMLEGCRRAEAEGRPIEYRSIR